MKSWILLFFVAVSINVFGAIHADFIVDKPAGCVPLLSNFTSTSTSSSGFIVHRWDFDNGNFSTMANPIASFTTSGVYRVKLIVSNPSGTEKDSVTKSVTVFRIPQIDFIAENVNVCDGDTLHLLSNVTLGNAPISDYAWGLGNGVASSGVNIDYVYPNPGTYDITLVVQDTNNCTSSLTKQAYVKVVTKPSADFTLSPGFSCNASEMISFTNTSSGSSLSFFWDFGNGGSSTLENPVHTYNQEITYATLTVTDIYGCVDSIKHKVTVTDVNADFTVTKQKACAGEAIQFSNTSNFPGTSSWDFGDGTGSNAQSPGKVYSTPGVYTVRLINSVGTCSDTMIKTSYITISQGLIPSFTFNAPPGDCNGFSPVIFTNTTPGSGLQFQWTFGDGMSTDIENPNHVFSGGGNYTVKLTVSDTNGCSIPVTQVVSVTGGKPLSNFNVPATSCPNTPVQFQNATQGGGAAYLWSFGDGETSTLQHPIHSYSAAGTYTVSLKVTNAAGCDSTTVKLNAILIEELVTDFNVNETYSPCPPFVATFQSTTNKPILTYFWDFGDNHIDTAANPTHIYFYPGIYTVSLAVKTSIGCKDTIVYPQLIEVQGPSGVFSASPLEGCAPLNVNFKASISSNTQTVWCDLGDGTLITDSLTFGHLYPQVGSYNPKFILVDHIGCTVPYDLPVITAYSPPVVNLFDTAICAGASINIPSLGTDQYKWLPSADIDCDTCSSVTILPIVTSDYIVTASNPYCSTSDTMHVFVDTLPILTPSILHVCRNSSVDLFSGNAYSISWSPAIYLNDSTVAQPVCTPYDSVIYDVTATNSLGCSVSSQVAVNVIDKIHVAAIGDITTCALDSFQLQASLTQEMQADINYTWTPANYFDSANVAEPVGHNLTNTTTFQVIVSTDNCIGDTAIVTVNVNALPVFQISESATTTPGAEVNVWASSTQNLSYQWTATDSLSCITCSQSNLYPQQTQTVFVTGTNESGCHTTDSVLIRVVGCDPESVFLPNVFTPNGDGLNDVLFLSSKALSSINYFRIFDEWGRMLYETKNMNDTWDGRVNGKGTNTDVFAYVLEGKCQNGETVLKYGNITIVK